MNARNSVKSSPLDSPSYLQGQLNNYINDVKKGVNKTIVKSIRKAFEVKDHDLMKLGMDKLPTIGKKESNGETFDFANFDIDWSRHQIIQIEVLDIELSCAWNLKSDKHIMIKHRNILENGYILWFYYEGPQFRHSEAIDTLARYLEDQYDLKLNLDKYKDPNYQMEIGFDPNIEINKYASAFNFKYLKKKFESRKQNVA